MPDRSGTCQIKIRRQPDRSCCCLIKIRQLPDRSGTCKIKIRRQPDQSGCCLIKIRHAWYQANLSAWSILLRQIRRSGKQTKFVRSLLMRHLDDTFWWEILMKHFDETFSWDTLMKIFDEKFWRDTVMRGFNGELMRHLDETFWWDILIRHFDETFWCNILMRHFVEMFWWDNWMRHLMRYFDETWHDRFDCLLFMRLENFTLFLKGLLQLYFCRNLRFRNAFVLMCCDCLFVKMSQYNKQTHPRHGLLYKTLLV